MSFDIWGNPLRPGHCEVHPHVHEEYPCSTCISDNRQKASHRETQYCQGGPDVCENSHYLGQAQSEIKRLNSRISELSAQTIPEEWISVKNRLPESKTQNVIVWHKLFYAPSFMTLGRFDGAAWVTNHDPRAGEITHWMPLPDAPRFEEKS